MRGAFTILFFSLFYLPVLGQNNPMTTTNGDSTERYVRIDKIFVIGNKTTKDNIILREVTIDRGEWIYYKDLKTLIVEDRNKVYNTGLFNSVEINILDLSNDLVDLVIKVDERWYLFPIPLLKFVDRNFNDWITNRNADFSRVVYGLKLDHYNMRGRNEKLELNAQFGYSTNLGINYKIPYIEKTQRHGLSFGVQYNELKNLQLYTDDHVAQFFETDLVLSENYSFGMGYLYRSKITDFHSLEASFKFSSIADTVAILNPNFYGPGKVNQDYVFLRYSYRKDKRDIRSYPLKGYQLKAEILKYGIGLYNDIDYYELKASMAKYFDLGNEYYLSNYISGYVSNPDDRPYSSYNGMGNGLDLVRGYELDFIEGPRYFVSKNTFKKKLFSGSKYWKKFPVPQFRTIPYALYLKTFVDFGYVQNFPNYEGNSRLTDRFIAGGGVGLDFITMYDAIFRVEYTVNKEQKGGIYLHFWQGF